MTMLSNLTFASVDTVLGKVPPGARNGDLATHTATSLAVATGKPSGSPPITMVVAKGCVAAGDGGGGIFFWESDADTDDGGTFIVPDGTVGSTGAGWKRFYSGPLNVQWFGTLANKWIPSDVAIQNAINAAAKIATAGHAAEVYIPKGEYMIQSSLIIPRLGFGNGLSIRGDGLGVTALVGVDLDANGQNGLAETDPVMKFDQTYQPSYFFKLEGMALQRRKTLDDPNPQRGGAIFSYVPTIQGNTPSRLILAVFRDVWFLSPDNPISTGVGWTSQSPLDLVHCHDCTFENIYVQGGESALRMQSSSRCIFTKLNVNYQFAHASKNGMSLAGVNATTFTNTRIESPGDQGVGNGLVLYADADGTQCSNLVSIPSTLRTRGCRLSSISRVHAMCCSSIQTSRVVRAVLGLVS